jgi:hypothetical protein
VIAKLRVMKKEVTMHAERRGHGLFRWKPTVEPGQPVEHVETLCARCGEEFSIDGVHKCEIAGPVNQPCGGKVA